MKNISFIGFDLDGTLINSYDAIYMCLKEIIPNYSSQNVDELINVVFPLTLDQFPKYINFTSNNDFENFKKDFIFSFDEVHYKNIKTIKYAKELLNFSVNIYGENNVFILTNRRHDSATQICLNLKITDIILKENIFSSIDDGTLNPKISSLKKVLSIFSNKISKGCYVGDSQVDIEAASSNNLHPVYISKELDDRIISDFNLKMGYNYFQDPLGFLTYLNNNYKEE